jgi:predicted extracellular nuclease
VQDLVGDGNPATSDAIFVFTFGSRPSVGDMVELTGEVEEQIGGGAATGNLSTTQMFQPAFTVMSSGNALPAPVIIGTGGLIPPNVITITRSETPVNLQNVPGVFNPTVDGIDFYEALEAMRVTVQDPVAVSGTRTFNAFSSEFFTLPDNGAHVAPTDVRTARGGINLAADADGYGDTNPERVQVQLDGTLYPGSVPEVTVGQRMGDITGVVGYSFGNFEVNATELITLRPSTLKPEKTNFRPNGEILTVATYNVLNLSPLASDDAQREILAKHIVKNLKRPDVIALQEIQDNNGTIDDGTVDARETLQALVDAIRAQGGPNYKFFNENPEDGSSGGVPGGNIRNAFLYNPNRVELVDWISLRDKVLKKAKIRDWKAFTDTRDPLQGTFRFDGKEFTVINNHLTSRFGSTPIFGGPQLFFQEGETARESQAQALNDWVDKILAEDRDANVMVVGDFNTFEFTDDLTEILPGRPGKRILRNLIDGLEDDNLYSFIFDGNSQVLDHFFVTKGLEDVKRYDIVHVNIDFPRTGVVGSDHDPGLARFDFARLDD